MANRIVMLTTVDNPWDPVDNFDSWMQFDLEKGYDSCALLAKVAKVSDQFSEEEYSDAVENAIDEIIKYDFLHVYKKFVKQVS